MKHENIVNKIEQAVIEADLNEIDLQLDYYLQKTEDTEASQRLSEVLYKYYTTYKSEYLAKIMEVIIRKRPSLAFVNHPQNFLFKTVLLTGSVDMYECYLEEAIIPFLQKKKDDDKEIYYMELQNTAQELSDYFFAKYPKCVKGLDYNSAFTNPKTSENVLSIHKQDYEALEDVAKKYNTILGRRDIITDLNKRAGLE